MQHSQHLSCGRRERDGDVAGPGRLGYLFLGGRGWVPRLGTWPESTPRPASLLEPLFARVAAARPPCPHRWGSHNPAPRAPRALGLSLTLLGPASPQPCVLGRCW